MNLSLALARCRLQFLAAHAFLVFAISPGLAAIIGTNTPSEPLTLKRIDSLPRAQRSVWTKYLDRSEQQRRADQAVLQKEMREHGIRQLAIPPEGRARRLLPLNRPDAWYDSGEARHIADVVISFQTPAGGWSKNLDMTTTPRAPGMHFVPDNSSRFLSPGDFDAPEVRNWNYVGTFDNDATIMQLKFLGKVISAIDKEDSTKYRESFFRGLDYIFASQYPNGGWPQVWPLQGGYHDAATFNDGALVNILNLLSDVSTGTNSYAFVPEKLRARAAASLKQGIGFILESQIDVNGLRTIWAQQYDPLTVRPTSARNYEMPSAAAGESAGVMMFLMRRQNPTPEIIRAVHDAAAWFQKTEIRDEAFRNAGSSGRLLVSAPGGGPIWSRYYEIGTDRPIFGDRDKTIHDDVSDISRERRNGYSWYVNAPSQALREYESWAKSHPRS